MSVMDLVAGDAREIVLTLAVDELAAFRDTGRFPAFLSLGSGLDPTWLDEFSRAARDVTGGAEPVDFLDARGELDGVPSERIVERVDREWVAAVGRLRDEALPSIAAHWIDRMDAEGDRVSADDKDAIYRLAGELVAFARTAAAAEDADVVFAWSL
jgi:hypothetical protein